MDDVEFRKPNIDDEEAHQTFFGEFDSANEKIIPSSVELKGLPFNQWLKNKEDYSKGINLKEGKVPASTYFLVQKNSRKILGAVNIRHQLTDHLLQHGGHIGYGVAPSERRKGYASYMLGQALDLCKNEHTLDKVLVTCDKNNIGSKKTIEKYGGVLENELIEEDGNVVLRYWIKL